MFGVPLAQRSIWVLGVGVFIAAVFGLAGVTRRQLAPMARSGQVTVAARPSSADVLAAELRYRREVRSLLHDWGRSPAGPAAVVRLPQLLLALTVPGRYRNVHLDLVIALTALRDAQAAGDAVRAADGKRKLETLIAAQSWIVGPDEGVKPPVPSGRTGSAGR